MYPVRNSPQGTNKMPFRRNRNRTQFYNDEKLYDEFFDKKNMKGFVQYASPWKTGDRFYKLAYDNYGNEEYWWIIALFNETPTESHVKLGDQILIPLDYELVIQLYGV